MQTRESNRVPWSIQHTFLGACCTLIPYFAFALASRLTSTGEPATTPLPLQSDITNAIALLVTALIIDSLFLLAPIYMARQATTSSRTAVRDVFAILGFRRFNWRLILPIIGGLFLAILALNFAYQLFIDYFNLPLETNDEVVLDRGRVAPITMYATLLAAVFIAPLCEEIFFRSFLFMGLLRGMSLPLALVLSSIIFGLTHIDASSFPVLFGIGLALGFLRWYSDSIWPSIILHFVNNAAGAIAILLALNGVGG